MKGFFLAFIGFTVINSYNLIRVTVPNSNKQSLVNKTNLNYSSSNCEVKSWVVKNSDYTNGKIFVVRIKKNKMSFVVTKKPSDYDFYINANFFADRPIGEVMIDKKVINKRKSGGGYFVSSQDNFDFTINSRPRNVSYSSQTHLVGIKNGKLNSGIMYQRWSKASAYRILLGKDKQGNFVALHSDRYAQVSIQQICEIGIKEGLVTGLVFDGGTSVDVEINDGLFSHGFSVVPSFARSFNKDLQPPVYIAGNFRD